MEATKENMEYKYTLKKSLELIKTGELDKQNYQFFSLCQITIRKLSLINVPNI